MDLLEDRWRRTKAGAGQCVLLTGEPGIGKSRLVRELRRRIPAQELLAYGEGRCAPDSRNHALHAIIEPLEALLGLDRERFPADKATRLESEVLRHRLNPAETLPLLLRLFCLPDDDQIGPLEASPQKQKELTWRAIVSLLLSIAEEQPVLLVIEDLHWADPTTLELLDYLVKEAASTALFLLLTARPNATPPFASMGVLQLALNRLERPEITAMVRSLVGHKILPRAVQEQVADRTDGVPLFVEELTKAILESGVLEEHADGYRLVRSLSETSIPSTLRALFTARLDGLGRAKETAQLAAALEREFSIEELCAASPLGPSAVEEDLDRLFSLGLVYRKRRGKHATCAFKHALVRDAAYESLSPSARRRAHARIAMALEDAFPGTLQERPDRLAHHFAAANQPLRAIEFGQRAAQSALSQSNYKEAASHASAVLEWTESIPLQGRAEAQLKANGILIQALMATRGWGDLAVKAAVDRSTALIEQLDEMSEHRITALWALFAYHHTASNRRDARRVAQTLVSAAARSGDRGLRAAALTSLGLAVQVDGDFSAAGALLEQAIEIYDPAVERSHPGRFALDSLVMARTILGLIHWFRGDQAAAHSLVESGIAWARELDHVPSLAIGLLYGSELYHFAGDKPKVARMANEIMALSKRYGLPAFEGYAATIFGWATGDAANVSGIVHQLELLGCKVGLSYWASLAAETASERGNFAEAITCTEQCLVRCHDFDEHFYEATLHLHLGLYLLQQGPHNATAAQAALVRAINLARRQDMHWIELQATGELVRRFGETAISFPSSSPPFTGPLPSL